MRFQKRVSMKNIQKLKKEIREYNSMEKIRLSLNGTQISHVGQQPCGCLFSELGLIAGLCKIHNKRFQEFMQ